MYTHIYVCVYIYIYIYPGFCRLTASFFEMPPPSPCCLLGLFATCSRASSGKSEFVCIYIYIYIKRERERERDTFVYSYIHNYSYMCIYLSINFPQGSPNEPRTPRRLVIEGRARFAPDRKGTDRSIAPPPSTKGGKGRGPNLSRLKIDLAARGTQKAPERSRTPPGSGT